MSEPAGNSRTVTYALAGVAVLLVIVAAAVIWRQSTAQPAATAPVSDTPAATTPATGTPSTPVVGDVDPATATKVPDGMTPEEMLTLYHQEVIDGKFAEAFKLLPKDKQASYGSVEAYKQQVSAYGITSFEIHDPTEDTGERLTVPVTQVTPQMPITYFWNFQKVEGVWYVAARTMG